MTLKPPTYAEESMHRKPDCLCSNFQCFGATRGMFRTVFSREGDCCIGTGIGIEECRKEVRDFLTNNAE